MKQLSRFRRLLTKLRVAKDMTVSTAPAQAASAPREKPSRRKTDSSFEPLEGRIAPAVLVNASTIQFTDSGGDLVTVQFSKALFKEANSGPNTTLNATLDTVFKFLEEGHVRTFADGGRATDVHELALVDLASLASAGVANPANGTSISITAEKVAGVGDDLVNVGYIKAAQSSLFGISLGKVVVDGDLGQIDAGDRKKSIGIESLTVNSWGALGTTTQLEGGTVESKLESNVTSAIGTVTVHGDYKDALLRVVNGDSAGQQPGSIGKLIIRGDILAAAGNNLGNAGAIAVTGHIGSIEVGNILGGGGVNSGKIAAAGKIGTITLEGDLRGGPGKDSGQIIGALGIGKISFDTLWAGAGEASGRISSDGDIKSITLQEITGHHAFAGPDSGKTSASISAGGKIASLSVAGNISGGLGESSGRVAAGTTLAKVLIGGHLIGGAGAGSGQLLAGQSLGSLIIEGAAQDYISVETVAGAEGVQEKHVLNFGDVLGRSGGYTLSYQLPGSPAQTTAVLSSASTAAQIQEALNALPGIGPDGVTVALQGGNISITFADDGNQAGAFSAAVTQANVVGAIGAASGSIVSTGSIGKLDIQNPSAAAALKAGTGAGSASISASGNIGSMVISGDLDGSGAISTAGAGGISAGGNIKSLTLAGNLRGGGGELTGGVSAEGSIGSVKITGSLFGGAGDSSGSVIASGKFSSAVVTGSLIGGSGGNSASLVAGTDITVPGDFGKVTVRGQMVGDGELSANIRSGGKLGTVTVGTAGGTLSTVLDGGNGGASASIVGRTGIGSVTINGHVEGGGGDNSGTIQSSIKIASVKIAGNLAGGVGDGSGSIAATDLNLALVSIPGDLGKITIAGSLLGDFGIGSGQIRADGSIQSVTVGGIVGEQGDESGSIVAGRGTAAFLDGFRTIGGIGNVVVKGAISGATGIGSGSIEAGARISALTVHGNVAETEFRTGGDFGAITINGDVSGLLISAEGNAKATNKADLAIAKLTVNGDVANSLFRAGYDLFDNAVNGNAQIGAVKVSDNWKASSIAAGVEDEEGDGFGDEDDHVIAGGSISRIASIVIGGALTGTEVDSDQFGFVAQTVGSVKIGNFAAALNNAKNTIPLAGTPVTNDTSIREVP